jgi:hypothetical protein
MDRRVINVAIQMDRKDGETCGGTSGNVVLASVLVSDGRCSVCSVVRPLG